MLPCGIHFLSSNMMLLWVNSQEMQNDEEVLGRVWNPEYLVCIVTVTVVNIGHHSEQQRIRLDHFLRIGGT